MRNPFRTPDVTTGPTEKVEDSFIVKVWKAPADYNRADRRAAHLWGRLWKWDAQALGLDPMLLPRYARRHWKQYEFTQPKTRRQRKHRARILKAMAARGQA